MSTIATDPVAHRAFDGKFGATATCDHYAWAATMRGDSALEVAAFLRARLLEHVQTLHQSSRPS